MYLCSMKMHVQLLLIILANPLFGQLHKDVFPKLKGDELYGMVVKEFTPPSLLDYSIARDTLFSKIDGVNNTLSCIYTGLTLPMPPGQDPTVAVFLNGTNNGINTEHVYPQGLGLENSLGRSNMHHLFPSKVKTNNDRGNLPFGESPDGTTKIWYINGDETSSKPSSNIDAYSELGNNGVFEPREAVKGDIARAVFYIHTIYREEVMAADQTFFSKQKDVLCQWHYTDPVDKKEWDRGEKIAKYQSNKNNPFVLDCSLAARLYCPTISAACNQIVSIPNDPVLASTTNWYQLDSRHLTTNQEWQGEIFLLDIQGRLMQKKEIYNGELLIPLDEKINTGLYFIVQVEVNKTSVQKIFISR
jgi:hypothetical protein